MSLTAVLVNFEYQSIKEQRAQAADSILQKYALAL
jgi:hypothetical protein